MIEIELEKAGYQDLDEIMDIIKVAQAHFRKEGIDQWQNDYPNEKIIKEDIDGHNSYVLKKEEIVIGSSAVIFDVEETYETIYEGQWLSLGEYAVIHRMAIDFSLRGSGLASIFLGKIEELCKSKNRYSIKVDTHRKNMPMQKLLLKNDYKECGIIYLEDKSERIAFEKLL